MPDGSGPIGREEWAELRRQALFSLPDTLTGKTLPEVLLTYQQKLLATTAAHQVTFVEKSRRTGYTWAVGADAVLTSAASREARGMDTLYIGYNLDMAREFIDVCGMWAKAFNQVASAVEEFVFEDKHKNGDQSIQAFRIAYCSKQPLTADTYGAARAAMRSIRLENGDAMDVTPGLLLVDPSNEGAANTITKADVINQTSNVWKGTANVLCTGRIL